VSLANKWIMNVRQLSAFAGVLHECGASTAFSDSCAAAFEHHIWAHQNVLLCHNHMVLMVWCTDYQTEYQLNAGLGAPVPFVWIFATSSWASAASH